MLGQRMALCLTLALALVGLCGCSSSNLSGTASANGDAGKTTKATAATDAADSTGMPAGAVKKGSFTVWAVPESPARWEDYQVFIQVALPTSAANYAQDDLSGQLAGTDLYKQDIQTSFHSKTMGRVAAPLIFKPAPQNATLMFWVPGAASHVEDTIDVSSKLLREHETISIQFK